MVLDEALEERIAEILAPLMSRWPDLDHEALRESNRKQAVIPAGSAVLDPVGTAPGLVVPPRARARGPTVVVLPGPPRELQPMWETALADRAFAAAIAGAHRATGTEIVRMFGIPESEIASTLRAATRPGSISTRLRSPPACAAPRSRSPPASSRRRQAPTTRCVAFIARAPRRHPVLARRLDRRRPGRRAS